MKNKIIALLVFGSLLGGWFWYDYQKVPEIHEIVPVSETGLIDATSRMMSATTTSATFTLVNTEKEYEYTIVVKDSQDQLVQILGPINLSDIAILGGDIRPEVIDANFDGFPDVRVQTCMGATGNTCYLYWTFSAFDGSYHEDLELSAIASPVFHSETKTITSHVNGGCAGACFVETTYSLAGGVPVLTEQVTQENKDDSFNLFVKVTKVLQNGKLATSSVEEVRYNQ